MIDAYRVRISDDSLVFSAAHFITYGGKKCERLHGHNYRVAAEVVGPLDNDSCVLDFIALRDMLKSVITGLDHCVILPTENPLISVTADDTHVEVTFDEFLWTFPRGDCILLPIANTTTELLSRHVSTLLAEKIGTSGCRPLRIRIEIEESPGQSAAYELSSE